MNTLKEGQIHDISLNMRKHLDITGVKDVVSFDEQSVIVTTVCGEMTVEGKDIRIGVLDTERGIVSLDGTVDAIFYSNADENKKQGLFGKLLK